MGLVRGAVVGLVVALALVGLLLGLYFFTYAASSGNYEVDRFGGFHAGKLDRNDTYTLEVDHGVDDTFTPLGAIGSLEPKKSELDVGPFALARGGIDFTSNAQYRLRLFTSDGVLVSPGPGGQGTLIETGLVLPWGNLWTWIAGIVIACLSVGLLLGAVVAPRRNKRPAARANSHILAPETSRRMDNAEWENPARPTNLVASASAVAAFPQSPRTVPAYPGDPFAPVASRAPPATRYAVRVTDREGGGHVQASAKNVDDGATFQETRRSNDGLLHFYGPANVQAIISAPGYEEQVVDLRANATTEVSLNRRVMAVEARVVGERTGQQLSGITVQLMRGSSVLGEAKSDLSGKVRFETTGSFDDCFLQTSVNRDGFQDDVAAIDSRSGALQLKVAYRFQPQGADRDAELGLRQDAEQLVRQATAVDPQVASWMAQAVAPFQEGMKQIAEWGGLLLASPFSPTQIHRSLAQEGQNLLLGFKSVLSDKAVMNVLSSGKKGLSIGGRLVVAPDLLQQLVRSPARVTEEIAKAAKSLTKTDSEINRLAATSDVLFVSLLWQNADRLAKTTAQDAERQIARCLSLAVQCALLDQVVKSAGTAPAPKR